MSARNRRRSVSAATDAECVASAAAADHLGLLELLGQRGDGLGRGAAVGETLGRIRPLLGEPRHVVSQRRVPAHRVVDLRHRGRAPGHLVVGVAQPLDRRRPLAGRAAGRR